LHPASGAKLYYPTKLKFIFNNLKTAGQRFRDLFVYIAYLKSSCNQKDQVMKKENKRINAEHEHGVLSWYEINDQDIKILL